VQPTDSLIIPCTTTTQHSRVALCQCRCRCQLQLQYHTQIWKCLLIYYLYDSLPFLFSLLFLSWCWAVLPLCFPSLSQCFISFFTFIANSFWSFLYQYTHTFPHPRIHIPIGILSISNLHGLDIPQHLFYFLTSVCFL